MESTARATGAPPSSTIARSSGDAARSGMPSSPRALATGSTDPRRFASPRRPFGPCGTRATAGVRMTSDTWSAGNA